MPGSCLWEFGIEVGKKINVREVLEAGSIVSRLVEGTRNVVCEADGPVEALVEGLKAEEFGRRSGSGGAALALPVEGGSVISAAHGGAFTNIKALSTTILMEEGTSQFQIGVSDVTMGIGAGDQTVLEVLGKGHAPNHRVETGAAAFAAAGAGADSGRPCTSCGGGEPHTTGAMAGSVMVAMDRGCQGDQFVQAGRPKLKVPKQFTKVVEDKLDVGGDGYPSMGGAITAGLSQGVLQEGEQTSGARKGKGHGTELAEELVPCLDRGALPRGGEFGVEKLLEAVRTAGSEPEGHVAGVQEPTEDFLGGRPGCIPLLELLEGDGGLPEWGVGVVDGAEDGINVVEEGPAHIEEGSAAALGSANEVVHVDVNKMELPSATAGQVGIHLCGEGHCHRRVQGHVGRRSRGRGIGL